MTKPKFHCRMDAAGSLQECFSQCAECKLVVPDNVGETDRWQDPRDISGGETEAQA